MKKTYRKPLVAVVCLQHQSHLLSGSNGVKSVKSNDGFTLKELDDDDDDV